MKTFLLTLTLAASSAFVGFYGQDAVNIVKPELAREVAAISAWYSYNPETSARACFLSAMATADTIDTECVQHVKAWAARDGQQEVSRELLAMGVPMILKTILDNQR